MKAETGKSVGSGRFPRMGVGGAMDQDLVLEAIDDLRALRLHLSALAERGGEHQRAVEVALGTDVLASVEVRLRAALGQARRVSWASLIFGDDS